MLEKNIQGNTPLRALDEYERFLWLSNQKKPFILSYAVRIQTSIPKKNIEKALNILQKHHPILRSIILGNNNPEFYLQKQYSNIPLSIKNKTYDDYWKQEIYDEMHTPFSYSQAPHMRVSYLKGKHHDEIIFTFDHLIGDGISARNFIYDFFDIIYYQLTENNDFAFQNNYPFQPPIETKVMQYQGKKNPSVLLKTRKKEFKIFSGKKGSSSGTGLFFHTFSRNVSKSIKAQCKKKQTTLQGVLSAASNIVLASNIDSSQGNIPIKNICTVDLRPYFKKRYQNSNHLNCYIGFVSFVKEFNVNSTKFWIHAKSMKESIYNELNNALGRKTMEDIHSFMTDISSHSELNKKRKWIGPLADVTNLGTINNPSFNHFNVSMFYLACSQHGMYYNENSISIISSIFNGELSLSFMYPENLMSPQKAKKIFKDIQLLLQNL